MSPSPARHDYRHLCRSQQRANIGHENRSAAIRSVVGQAVDKCGNLITPAQRREAIINQRVIAGMSQQDVESALGKPDKISIRNSATSYRYDTKRGRSANIEFDERGCTKEKPNPRRQKARIKGGLFCCMVHSTGFEPVTARFVAEYSIQLSYECNLCF